MESNLDAVTKNTTESDQAPKIRASIAIHYAAIVACLEMYELCDICNVKMFYL